MEREIERWTREVAEDPGAASFVRLARAYRARGQRDAARRVVLSGLERNPEHIDGHGLLALIYVEDGARQKAGDEWQTVLRLDPGNFHASRGLGFLALERNDLAEARRHLERAAAARPHDPAVSQALEVLARREAGRRGGGDPARSPAAAGAAAPAASASGPAPATAGTAPAPATGYPDGATVRDPTRLFDVFMDESPFVGAVLLDAEGRVLAGRIPLDEVRSDLLGAIINTAVVEARRTTRLLGLDAWQGMVLDCDHATIHLAGLAGEEVVLVAARRGAPAGWGVRTAERALRLARTFLEARP